MSKTPAEKRLLGPVDGYSTLLTAADEGILQRSHALRTKATTT